MSLFALADTHLSLGENVDKPMDVFGAKWTNHADRLAEAWQETVGADDLVLVPGDISWAMKLEDALPDLEYLDRLPGTKLLLKGNHDYWWTSRGKVERVLPPSLRLLQYDSYDAGDGIGIVGTRGWIPPSFPKSKEADEKIYARELQRMELSIKAAGDRFETLIAMMHYPPLYRDPDANGLTETDFVPLLEAAGVRLCVYGHLHGPNQRVAVEGEHRGVRYRLVAADALRFRPARIRLADFR